MNETINSINQWAEETFGPCTSQAAMVRAAIEMDEYLATTSYNIEEAADVIITLYRIPGIQEAINKKMAINRQRKWKLNGDGTGQHVKSKEELGAECMEKLGQCESFKKEGGDTMAGKKKAGKKKY